MTNDFNLTRGTAVICELCHTPYILLSDNEPICPRCLFGERKWDNDSESAREFFRILIKHNHISTAQAFSDMMGKFDLSLSDVLACYQRFLDRPSEVVLFSLLKNLGLLVPLQDLEEQFELIEEKVIWREFVFPNPRNQLWKRSADSPEDDSASFTRCAKCNMLTSTESSHCRLCKSPFTSEQS